MDVQRSSRDDSDCDAGTRLEDCTAAIGGPTDTTMSDFKDKIAAASGKVEFLYDATSGRIAQRISRFRAAYFVAVSPDGRQLLTTVPATGIGQTPVYPQPSVLTFIQSDEQGMWGRNCPLCKKYFRTNHVDGVNDITFCPYCSYAATSLAFISKEQRTYITAFYDALMRAVIKKTNTALDIAEITDETPAWHYSEEKQQFHFVCDTKDCHAETDILGDGYGYCPRCGRTNGRKLFFERMNEMSAHWEDIRKTISDENERGAVWEDMTEKCVKQFEAFAKHLRAKVLRFPMTSNRRRELEGLSFQRPFQADESLTQWFDIGLFEWPGNPTTPKRSVPKSGLPFIRLMFQKRHILMHNLGVVDEDYLNKSGDNQVRLHERIRVSTEEIKRFIESIQLMGSILLDNVEFGFDEG